VRTLGDDIAGTLGGRAHLSALRRVRNGTLHVNDAVQISDIEAAAKKGEAFGLVLSARDGLPDLPEVVVGDDLATGVGSGLSFPVAAVQSDITGEGPVRIVNHEGRLLAVYRLDSGKAFPEVVIA
jgi:tRNA pseudouridine55 synthase